MKERIYRYTNTIAYPVRLLGARRKGSVMKEKSLENLNKGYRTKGISEVTKRKILQHCRMLALLAQRRTVRNSKGEYRQHHTLFITLTLPSEQVHEDAHITRECLGMFFDKCRKIGILKNYVWKAEKQKNGNIHYHILTDTYTSFSFIKRIWLVSVEKLGYVSEFQEKFSKMTFEEYRQQTFNKQRTPQQIAGAYEQGRRERWRNPPSVSVDFIQDEKALVLYIAKYVSKEEKEKENFVNGRTWGVSNSVKASVKDFKNDSVLNEFWYNTGKHIMKSKTFEQEYFSVCLFSLKSLFAWFSDTFTYFKEKFKKIFEPCKYYLNTLGLFHVQVP